MDKNEKEKKMLYEWGTKNSSLYQKQKEDKGSDSYYIKRDVSKNIYIREYGFETLPELINELDHLWENDEVMEQIKHVIGIASLKNKPGKAALKEAETDDEKRAIDKENAENKLPVFIYNF